MKIKRTLLPLIEQYLSKRKIIILYGARQVGKTTLAKELFKDVNYLYLNGDDFHTQSVLSEITLANLSKILQNYEYLIIDEAQRIKNIGIILKMIQDNFVDKKVIATWSSSFELANTVNEPLTWRKVEFQLYPFSLEEGFSQILPLEHELYLKQRMITGLYPENTFQRDERLIRELVNSYVYKDLLTFEKIKKSDVLVKLLQSLALQIGNEVSYQELWEQCWVNSRTVEHYIEILEQAFIVFRLQPYTLNQRTGIKKMKKIYFLDLGVRNTLINNLNPLELRTDIGGLRENFVITEIIKSQRNHGKMNQYYFRRDGQTEMDFLIEKNGILQWYEIKYNKNKGRHFDKLKTQLSLQSLEIINKDNFEEIMPKIIDW